MRSGWQVIAGHELRTQLKSSLFWVMLAVTAAAISTLNPVAMIAGGRENGDGVRAFANSMHALAPTFAMSAFFVFPFFVSLMAGLAVLRDEEAGMNDLLHSTPLSARGYVWGKFAGVLAVGAIGIVAQLLTIIGFREAGLGGIAPGPFSLWNYLVPALVFALPLVVGVMAVAFVVGTRTRQPMAVYSVPLLLLTLNFFLFWNWRPEGIAPWLDQLLMIVDPTGLRWLSHSLFLEDQGVAHYNRAAIAFDGIIVAGRIVAIAVPLLLVVHAARAFERRIRGREGRRVAGVRSAPAQSAGFGSIADLIAPSRLIGTWRGTLVILRAELRELSRRPSLYLFLIFLMAVVHEAGATDQDAYGAAPIVTAGAFATATLPVITLLASFFLLLLVIELLHRDQVTRFESIGHAMPVPTGAILGGRGLAIGCVILAVAATCTVTGLLAQQGGPSGRELGPLLLIYGVALTPTLLLWCSFVAAAFTLTRSRNAALAAGFAALLLTGAAFLSGSLTWVSNWPLWLSLPWSDLGVLPLNGEALWLNRALGLCIAVALMIATRLGYRRIEPDAARRRAGRGRRLAIGALRLAPALAMSVVVAGFLSVRIESGDRVVPTLSTNAAALLHAKVDIALDPARQQMSVKGSYLLRTATGDSVVQEFAYETTYPEKFTRNGGGAESFILPEGVSLSTHRGRFLPMPGEAKGVITNAAFDASAASESFNHGERFTAEVTVAIPSEYRVAVSAAPVGESDDGKVRISRWRTEAPVTALSLHAGRWSAFARGDLTVQLHPSHQVYAPAMMDALLASTSTFSRWFGPLPWSTLQLTEAPAITSQATSYPGSITISESLILHDSSPSGSMLFDVVAHEVAHQWWGHMVTAAEGPGTGWLVEGLADYSMLALVEARHGPERAAATVRRLHAEYLDGRNATRERSLLESEETVAQDLAVLQKRGALVLWMLGNEFGRERIHAGLREFVRRSGQRATVPEDLLLSLRSAIVDTVRFDAFVSTYISGTAPLAMD